MTDKIVLTDIASGFELSKINNNFQAIKNELNNKVLYRNPPDNTTNTLEKNLDINNKRIYNLPTPVANSEPATKAYVDQAAFDASGVVIASFFVRSNNLSDVLDTTQARTNLGLGSMATKAATDYSLATHLHTGVYEPADATILRNANIGTTVQAYDVDTAKTDVAQNFTAPQRSAPLTDNDLSFDLSAKQNFTSTPTGAATLTFTNLQAGQSGSIILVNTTNYVISKASTTKTDASFLSTVSATGTYRLSYYCDGTNVYVSTTGALS